MVEIRRGSEGGSSGGPGGERLPWLEPVEDEDGYGYGPGPDDHPGSYGGVIAAMLAVLVGIAIVTAGVVWFRHHRAATADIGEVIHPEPGPYKIKPPVTGGLDTEQTGKVAAGTSAGQDEQTVMDYNAVPEKPMITRRIEPGKKPQLVVQPSAPPPAPVALPKPEPAPALKPAKATTAPATPLSPSATFAGTIQLGAFSSEEKAKAAWKTLSGRFAMLKEMTPAVTAVDAGDNHLFRLRATGATLPPAQICARMHVAGDTCSVVGE
jgi:hypothetical protein